MDSKVGVNQDVLTTVRMAGLWTLDLIYELLNLSSLLVYTVGYLFSNHGEILTDRLTL